VLLAVEGEPRGEELKEETQIPCFTGSDCLGEADFNMWMFRDGWDTVEGM